ncbi:MAG: hypothetical protein WAR79_18005 [Melioribacteraceae bacterium]
MKQTNEQIQIISDNNKFNNFYKHREDFIDFYKSTAYYRFSIVENDKTEVINDKNPFFYPIYSSYYYPSYHTFQPKRNSAIIDQEKRFLIFLSNSLLNCQNYSLLSIIKEDIKPIFEASNFINSIVAGDSFMSSEIKQFKAIDKAIFEASPKQTSESISIISLIIPIYWRYIFLLDLISFDGEEITEKKCEAFEDNYSQLCMNYDLIDKYGNRFKMNP